MTLITNVGELKIFVKDIPDDIPVVGYQIDGNTSIPNFYIAEFTQEEQEEGGVPSKQLVIDTTE